MVYFAFRKMNKIGGATVLHPAAQLICGVLLQFPVFENCLLLLLISSWNFLEISMLLISFNQFSSLQCAWEREERNCEGKNVTSYNISSVVELYKRAKIVWKLTSLISF